MKTLECEINLKGSKISAVTLLPVECYINKGKRVQPVLATDQSYIPDLKCQPCCLSNGYFSTSYYKPGLLLIDHQLKVNHASSFLSIVNNIACPGLAFNVDEDTSWK